MSESEGFFLSRQPIVGAGRRFVGWELVLGSASGEPLALDPDRSAEYVAAIKHVATSAAWDAFLCGGRALLRVGRDQLFGDLVEQMPRNRLWLGLQPEIEVDEPLSSRLHTLHRLRGTRLLFFDYDRRDPREPLLDLADAVEVDTLRAAADAQELLIRRAHRRKLQVLAQSVNSEADLTRNQDLGFDLFQGLFYADGGASEEAAASVDGRVLLELLLAARDGLELDEVAVRVEANPLLADGLLRLVNSLALARAQKIESVQQALMMIGADGLTRWLFLLLFQVGGPHGNLGPLFRVAASRARLMELLVCDGAEEDPEIKRAGETAFLIGILSLVHVLLGVDRKGAIDGLSLGDEIRAALTDYAGDLGAFLRLAECLDAGAFPEVAAIAQERSISPQRLFGQQCAAYEWILRMM